MSQEVYRWNKTTHRFIPVANSPHDPAHESEPPMRFLVEEAITNFILILKIASFILAVLIVAAIFGGK